MASFTTFVLVYLFGGLTFLPLLLGLAIYFGTQAVPADETPDVLAGKAGASGHDGTAYDDGLTRPGDDTRTTEAVRRELARENELRGGSGKKHRHDPADDFAASGYFAVYRKFVTAGVNTRPVEPSTVGLEPVAPASPSVYQTFFRSMLNKKPSQEAVAISKAASPRPKNARNMFYVVLRHGYLILFDDDRQVDVRHVIKLADHDVGVYAGSDTIPEGELFIKRNAVRLAPKSRERVRAHNAPTPQPWFFYCENCSDKEDFYFALLRSQQDAPQPLAIDVRHLTALMERLHASEEAAETRWLNALIGRLFLGVAKTPDMLRFVEAKIATKLARLPRPGFVSSLAVQRVDVGESTPQITSPRLKSLSAEGECVVEADVRYAGRFEVDLAATMRISMPIGQQEVKTSLAVVLTHLEGHVLFKIKAPPSNRIWFTFRQMPKVEMEIRPIVMARQLTWPVFLTLIENKLKEAIADSIVLPFWDDTPFFRTDKKKWRGGLWDEADDEAHGTRPDAGEQLPMANTDGPAPGVPEGPAPPDTAAVAAAAAGGGDGGAGGKSTGMARDGQDENVSPAVLRLRRLSKTHSSPATVGSTAAAANAASEAGSRTTAPSVKSTRSHKKRQSSGDDTGPFPSSSKRFSQTNAAFAGPSEPTTGTDSVHAEAFIPPSSPPKDGKPGSAAAMAWLSSNARRHSRSSASSADVDAAAGTPAGREGLQRNRSSRTLASLGTSVEGQDAEMADDPLFDISDSEAGTRSGRPTTASTSAWDSSSSLHSSRTTTAASEAGNSTPRAIRRKPVEASASATSTEGGSSTSTTDKNGTATAGASPAAATPPKRTAVLAAAMNDAAVSAKRWGINVLQQRRAAQAERRARTATSSVPLDLSKPMGGGRPLPPVGEPLPLPRELAQAQHGGTTTSGASAGSDASPKPQRIHRKPAPAPTTAAQQQQHHHQQEQQHQQQQQQNDLGHYRHRRRGSSQLLLDASSGFPQQDLLVVAAPVDDSESDGDNGANGNNSGSAVDGKTTTAVAEDTGAQEAASNAPPLTDKTSDLEETPEAKADGPSSESADEPGKADEVDEADEAEDDEDDAQWGELAESVMSAFLEEGKQNDTAVPTEATNGDRDVGTTVSASPDETAVPAAPEKEAAQLST